MTIDSPLVRGSASPVRPSAAQSAQAPTSLPVFQAGFSLFVYGNPEDFIERSEEILDHLVTLNVNALSLTFFLYQDSWTASVIYEDDNQTLNSENLKAFAAAAHEREIAVTLRPLLEEESLIPDGRWRGSIEPSDIEGWFNSYSSILMKYAALAEESGVEALSVGAELQSLEPYASYWASLIDSVRESYSGAITYSFNWNSPSQTLLELTSLLDFIGIDAFYPLGAPSGASTETLIAAWQPWLEQVHALHVTSGKPIVFSEIGTRSQPGSYQAPWQWVS
jgi:hypothetical protein